MNQFERIGTFCEKCRNVTCTCKDYLQVDDEEEAETKTKFETINKMKYLVTYIENGIQKAFYTNWFDIENNFNSEVGMVVFDLVNHKYMVNSLGWINVEEDHL